MKVIVCTEYGENYKEIAKITVPIFREYCQRHGYEFRELLLEDGNDYAFKKHELFRELMMDDIDVIAYFDVDILVTNLSFKIEDFLDNEHDYFLTKDFNELNNGACIIKNTEGGRWINDLILASKDFFDNEQNTINSYMISPQFNQFVKVLQHPSINSYDYSLYPECKDYRRRDQGHWHEYDFVLHVPALGLEKRIEKLKNTPIIR
jgi:hypothetical protein